MTVLSQGAELASSLLTTKIADDFRVYSPSYSIPQQTAAYNRLSLADGVDPIQLSSYRDFMVRASGVPSPGYSVSIPPFATGEPKTDNQAYSPDPYLLGMLNVRFMASEFPIQKEGFRFVKRYGTTYLYHNQYERPRVWLQSSSTDAVAQGNPVLYMTQANQISLVAKGPGLAVVSISYYPGWKLTVDGVKTDPVLVEGVLIGARLSAGNHEILLKFSPDSFYLGGAISLTSMALVALCVGLNNKRVNGHA
jgi:uncharacterized membrane protein YfhO